MSAGSVNLNDRDLDELFKLADELKGVQDVRVQKSRYTAMLNDVLSRTDTAIDMQVESAAYMRGKVKYIGGIVIVLGMLLIANFAITLSALEMSKESHVKGSKMVSLTGYAVQTENPEMTLKDGALVARTSDAGSTIATSPKLSKYKLSSRIPNKYLAELESFTVASDDGESGEIMKVVVSSFRRIPAKGSNCGSVVEFQTSLGSIILDDESLFLPNGLVIGDTTMGDFDLGSKVGDPARRLANMKISAYGRGLLAAGMEAQQSGGGAFKFMDMVDTSGWSCTMGGIIGQEYTVEPPASPAVPFAYTAKRLTKCTDYSGKDMCMSSIMDAWKPGVEVLPSGLPVMVAYVEVLATRRYEIHLAHYAAYPETALVQVTDLSLGLETKYVVAKKPDLTKPHGLVYDADKKGYCQTDISPRVSEQAIGGKLSLAYLGQAGAKSNDFTGDQMWTLLAEGDQTGATGGITLWTEKQTSLPSRVFAAGAENIGEGANASFAFMAPMEFLDFRQKLSDKDVTLWMEDIGEATLADAMVCPEGETAGGVDHGYPLSNDPYSESEAFAIVQQSFTKWSAGALRAYIGRTEGGFAWPRSRMVYWLALAAHAKLDVIANIKDAADADEMSIQGASHWERYQIVNETADQGRRLGEVSPRRLCAALCRQRRRWRRRKEDWKKRKGRRRVPPPTPHPTLGVPPPSAAYDHNIRAPDYTFMYYMFMGAGICIPSEIFEYVVGAAFSICVDFRCVSMGIPISDYTPGEVTNTDGPTPAPTPSERALNCAGTSGNNYNDGAQGGDVMNECFDVTHSANDGSQTAQYIQVFATILTLFISAVMMYLDPHNPYVNQRKEEGKTAGNGTTGQKPGKQMFEQMAWNIVIAGKLSICWRMFFFPYKGGFSIQGEVAITVGRGICKQFWAVAVYLWGSGTLGISCGMLSGPECNVSGNEGDGWLLPSARTTVCGFLEVFVEVSVVIGLAKLKHWPKPECWCPAPGQGHCKLASGTISMRLTIGWKPIARRKSCYFYGKIRINISLNVFGLDIPLPSWGIDPLWPPAKMPDINVPDKDPCENEDGTPIYYPDGNLVCPDAPTPAPTPPTPPPTFDYSQIVITYWR